MFIFNTFIEMKLYPETIYITAFAANGPYFLCQRFNKTLQLNGTFFKIYLIFINSYHLGHLYHSGLGNDESNFDQKFHRKCLCQKL